MVIFLCRFCGKWMGVYFSSFFFEQSVDFTVVIKVILVDEMCGVKGLRCSSNGAELRILYYRQFLDKRCGTHKNWCF